MQDFVICNLIKRIFLTFKIYEGCISVSSFKYFNDFYIFW